MGPAPAGDPAPAGSPAPAGDPAPAAGPAAADPAADAFESSLALVLDPAGWELLDSLPPYVEADALRLGERLRAEGHDPALVAAALTQSRLRAKATEKFGDFAARMLFTPDGLEQATRLPVAALHARRFRDAGVTSVADLGCGIGGDAMAAAALGLDVLAVDRDPVTAAVATVNLQPFDNARVDLGAAEDHDPGATDGIWLDPARRTARTGGRSRRLHHVRDYQPPLPVVRDLAARIGAAHGPGAAGPSGDGPLGVKLGPAIAHEDLPPGTETQWLSWHGQVLEAACWFGPLAADGVARSALVVDRDGAHRLAADPTTTDPTPGPLGQHLYEPDGAVIRAGTIATLAEHLGLTTIDAQIAYLTGETHLTSPFLTGYTVRDVLPYRMKTLSAYLRERRIGILEIKKRGGAIEPEDLRRRLRPRRFGEESATLVLTRIADEHVIIVATPHAAAA